MPYGLFRTSYFHNPAQCSHIVKLTPHFYVYAPLRSVQNEHPLDVLHHIGAVHKIIKQLLCKHIMVSDFWLWHHNICWNCRAICHLWHMKGLTLDGSCGIKIVSELNRCNGYSAQVYLQRYEKGIRWESGAIPSLWMGAFLQSHWETGKGRNVKNKVRKPAWAWNLGSAVYRTLFSWQYIAFHMGMEKFLKPCIYENRRLQWCGRFFCLVYQ